MTNGGTGGSAATHRIGGARRYRAAVDVPKHVSRRRAEKLGERERAAGLDSDDAAARWLAEHDREPEPERPKRATKSKALHRWRQSRGG